MVPLVKEVIIMAIQIMLVEMVLVIVMAEANLLPPSIAHFVIIRIIMLKIALPKMVILQVTNSNQILLLPSTM
jgi:hypothetical protein